MWNNSYATLPDKFFARIDPRHVSKPYLIKFNWPLANELGFQKKNLTDENIVAFFSGNTVPVGASPVAMAYAGHQFGNFVPSLGDGRAVLLGEVLDRNGISRDIQLKGSGPTPFSRRGDGRSPLGPAMREYIVSEAMNALGVPTTRSLALIGTGETVTRETDLPGGISTRVARSHIRVGTFQYFAVRHDIEAVRQLADYAIARLYPELKSVENPYLAFLGAVIEKQARLIADWMATGFIHGVMNTDNMTISGETIDYGPCAFMDDYRPDAVFSSIDVYGRYAYANQPSIAQWNLTRFAECLVPLLDQNQQRAIEKAQHAVEAFEEHYEGAVLRRFAQKIGIDPGHGDTEKLVASLLDMMAAGGADFTLTFRAIALGAGDGNSSALENILPDAEGLAAWLGLWRKTRRERPHDTLNDLKTVNPLYIPRNHLVEEAIRHGLDGDFSRLNTLMEVLSDPFTEREGIARYALPPAADERVERTFCGT